MIAMVTSVVVLGLEKVFFCISAKKSQEDEDMAKVLEIKWQKLQQVYLEVYGEKLANVQFDIRI